MLRWLAGCISAGILCALTSPAGAQMDLSGPPVTYEVQINGESFQVEGNRMLKVESKQKPGTRYELAVRVSPTQHLRLNSVQLDYELPAKVVDAGPGKLAADGRRPPRTCRIEHELGFNVMLTDLNQPLDDKARDESLKILTDSVSEGYREGKVEKLEIGKPYAHKFAESEARGANLRYTDARGYKHTCLLYVFSGETFAATCVVQYLDKDADGGDLLPLVRKTLDSIRGLK